MNGMARSDGKSVGERRLIGNSVTARRVIMTSPHAVGQLLDVSRSSAALALASSRFRSGLTVGNASFRPFSASMTAAATTHRANHFLFPGTTTHGAYGVAVPRIMSSYAVM